MTDLPIINAAVAVIVRCDKKNEITEVLLAERPEGKPWAGWWEFPGGKIESGESPLDALKRELQEELGIEVSTAYPWLMRSFDYPDKTVKLHFFIVREWNNKPHGKEGQTLSWQNPHALDVSPMLPANTPILDALSLSHTYAITHLSTSTETQFFSQLKNQLTAGLQLIQIREKDLSLERLSTFAKQIINIAKPYGAKVIINGDIELAKSLNADGVHFTSIQLMQMSEKPPDLICGASCHNREELDKAIKLDLDFAVLSPIKTTLSHPETPPLGWDVFSEIAKNSPMPIYALGGMEITDLMDAWEHGAHGIAMQRGAWK